MENLTQRIARHEGLRLHPYKCPANKLTIGYGRNLEDRGITKDEAMYLLQNDLLRIKNGLSNQLDLYHHIVFHRLEKNVQEVLIEMAYQIGIYGLLKFKKMLNAVFLRKFDLAAKEMLDSKWAKQTPRRAKELSNIMKGGI